MIRTKKNINHPNMPQDVMSRNAGKAASMLKQLANAKRLMILCTLTEGEQNVGKIIEKLDISQSALSQHLARLKTAGLISAEKRGQMVFYKIANMEVQALLSTLYLIYCKQ